MAKCVVLVYILVAVMAEDREIVRKNIKEALKNMERDVDSLTNPINIKTQTFLSRASSSLRALRCVQRYANELDGMALQPVQYIKDKWEAQVTQLQNELNEAQTDNEIASVDEKLYCLSAEAWAKVRRVFENVLKSGKLPMLHEKMRECIEEEVLIKPNDPKTAPAMKDKRLVSNIFSYSYNRNGE